VAKTDKSPFVPLFVDLGVTYTVYLWLVGKRVVNVDFLLVLFVLIKHFSLSLTVERYERMLVEVVLFDMEVGHFEREFQEEEGVFRKLESLGDHVALQRKYVSMILYV